MAYLGGPSMGRALPVGSTIKMSALHAMENSEIAISSWQ